MAVTGATIYSILFTLSLRRLAGTPRVGSDIAWEGHNKKQIITWYCMSWAW